MVPRVLIIPDWHRSHEPAHWPGRWAELYGYARLEQHEGLRPLRGDWTIQLEEAVLASRDPLVLAAHGLGCILVAWWAAHSRHAARVVGALLVSPRDIEQDEQRQIVPGWTPIPRQALPFKSVLVASHDDPRCSLEKASLLALDWGASFYQAGSQGGFRAESGMDDWAEGHALLLELLAECAHPANSDRA